MRTSELVWLVSGFANCKVMAMIGLSSDTDDVSETVCVEVFEGGLDNGEVVVV